ncbi:MAG TPA: tetratricopeptide repeat protein [Pirellulales bacterium]|jgi:tetratricopeptide (TPR) repeat protein|nr:tetratricopeptide repeat protein [Pirellulales bacterium]
MARDKDGVRINRLLEQGRYGAARGVIERELESEPKNHWLLTQLGVTFYEQKRYKEALRYFEASRKILPDCPLTRWNLAGALDALGQPEKALQIYTSLLESKLTSDEDPCWESAQWGDKLKANCVYRIGVCLEHLGNQERAEWCYRKYAQLLMAGVSGLYSIDDVMRHISSVRGAASTPAKVTRELQKVWKDTLSAARQSNGGQDAPARSTERPKRSKSRSKPGERPRRHIDLSPYPPPATHV